ncbi:MAG: membrane-bound lytic murein transglycosylase MltF [Desulfobacterales bacterium]|nr:membrane-bound lytic murein transglycosylase MltF [Desulfobacterales bacterium]
MYLANKINNLIKKPAVFIPFLVLIIFFSIKLFYLYKNKIIPSEITTLDDILKVGEITLITRNNAHCYYIYREQAMGFEYDLAKEFAKYIGVKLNVKLADTWEDMVSLLKENSGNFIGASITITPRRIINVSFSDGYMTIQPRIVTSRYGAQVNKLEDLDGKLIHVSGETFSSERLKAIDELGLKIDVKIFDGVPTEELIRQVSDKQIPFTIADSNIALLNIKHYPNIVLGLPINDKEFLAWAVNRDARKLRECINFFFRTIKENNIFEEIYNRYYNYDEHFDLFDLSVYHERIKTRFPSYKATIKEMAEKYEFDWRLIAAQVYQESHFEPNAQSHAGAYGLMQITRSTAESLGVKNILNPEENIEAGVKLLKKMYDIYDKSQEDDRLFIALAAYNVGQGHIIDARNIARKMGLNPNKWSSISKTLPLLEKKEYYLNARYGYCRGSEPVKYIKQIMIYYDILKHKSIEENSPPLPQEKIKNEQIFKDQPQI